MYATSRDLAGALSDKLPKVQPGVPLGIEVSSGTALWLLWASFVAITLSLFPYFVRYVSLCSKAIHLLMNRTVVTHIETGSIHKITRSMYAFTCAGILIEIG